MPHWQAGTQTHTHTYTHTKNKQNFIKENLEMEERRRKIHLKLREVMGWDNLGQL